MTAQASIDEAMVMVLCTHLIDGSESFAVATCQGCRCVRATYVRDWQVWNWLDGKMLQEVWPEKTPDQREIIHNSQYEAELDKPWQGGPMYYCPACWDVMFEDMEEDDEG
jgi:hypothetical protein